MSNQDSQDELAIERILEDLDSDFHDYHNGTWNFSGSSPIGIAEKKLKALVQKAVTEARKVGELHGLGYYNDAFHDLPAPDVEQWYLNQRDRLDEEIAELTEGKQ